MEQQALEAWRARAALVAGETLPIVKIGEPGAEILRQKARPVRHLNRRVRELIARMRVTMYRANGIGLAAPQVGVGLRLIVVDTGDKHCVLINPEVVSAQGSQVEPMEGCLSIPDLAGEVERAQRVRVKGLDGDGREVWIDAQGYFARALQHEVDHLDGVLFTDRARRVVRAAPETKLTVVFMGTSAVGATVLDALLEADVVPALVVTQPDRPAGRGLQLHPSPVRVAAEAAGCTVATPARVRGDAEFLQALRDLEPDVLVTAAYGQIVPQAVLDVPRLGAVNVHPSLLPHYRGADPIRRALWNAEAETGVTIAAMTAAVDAGDILAQEVVPIAPEEDGQALAGRLAEIGGRLLVSVLHQLAVGKATPRPQDHGQATLAPKIAPEEEIADFGLPARELAARIRALAPRPGLRTAGGLKLLRAAVLEAPVDPAAPGTMVAIGADGALILATGQGQLAVTEVQPAGGRPMTGQAYANGQRLGPGAAIG